MPIRTRSRFRFAPDSLHAKVSLWIVVPLLLILMLFTAYGYRRQQETTLHELSQMAAYTGYIIESDVRHQMLEGDFNGIQALLDGLGGQGSFESLYLLDTQGTIIFSAFDQNAGMQLDNRNADCQPCHSLPVAERPASIVVTSATGQQVFRSMQPIENSPECAECHTQTDPLIGMLLIDIPVAPFTDRLTAYLTQNLLLWLSIVVATTLIVYLVVDRLVLRRLSGLLGAISGLGRGRRPPVIAEGSRDEIGQLVRSFNEMTHQLEARSAQNQELSNELAQQNAHRGLLLERLITAQEDERVRVARELHDELGQSLTGLALHSQALERYVASEGTNGTGHEILSQIRRLIGDTTEQMYDIIMALRPSILDDLGLVPALRAYAERTLDGSQITFTLEDSDLHRRLPAQIETALFRIFQEGITNALRHSGATRLHIRLGCDGANFVGELRDNGHGFDPAAVQTNGHEPRGLGLLGMEERVAQCGGTLVLESNPDAGTRILITIPLLETDCASAL